MGLFRGLQVQMFRTLVRISKMTEGVEKISCFKKSSGNTCQKNLKTDGLKDLKRGLLDPFELSFLQGDKCGPVCLLLLEALNLDQHC